MAWYEKLISAHTAVTNSVSHVKRLKSSRYFVWQEDGENALTAGNTHTESAVSGSTDLYTKQEFDPWAGQLSASFDANGISYSYAFIDYEEDTGFYHHEWQWEVV